MRKSGVLMHVSSLPSPCGIGTFGSEARRFVDFLVESGQSCWQVLPLSPTGYGDSPYQSVSAFAGNPYFIDLDMLAEAGLLQKEDYVNFDWGSDPQRVDYKRLFEARQPVLRMAVERFLDAPVPAFACFCRDNASWLDDYALFMALKDAHGGAPWTAWEPPLRSREPHALAQARTQYAEDIAYYQVVQYLFFEQWTFLHAYARERGIEIIGDIPIYAAADSADVWAQPELFELDAALCPVEVAGCPPDGFSADGQLWGNPLYDWERQKKTGYAWWIARIRHALSVYDVLRIDHFRGFDAYYAIPFGDEAARNGQWREGPGIALFNAFRAALGELPIIAEDLGFLTDSVRRCLAESGFPGMKVMQFAFDGNPRNPYLPHNFKPNCVAYTGTHDNDTILGWFETAPRGDVERAKEYLRLHPDESAPRCMLAALWASCAEMTIAQMQDLLELGSDARMNTPGTLGGNWQWRMRPDADLRETARWLRHMTELYGRAG